MTTPVEVGADGTATRTTPPVTRTQIVRFAGAGGDFNPMHHDEPFAQAAGEDAVFAMGQLTAAIVAEFAADWLGRETIAGYGVRFRGKVRPGDALALRGTPGATGDDGDRYDLEARRVADGEVVLTGWARVRPGSVGA